MASPSFEQDSCGMPRKPVGKKWYTTNVLMVPFCRAEKLGIWSLTLQKKLFNYLSVKVERKRKKTVSPRANGFSYMFRSG